VLPDCAQAIGKSQHLQAALQSLHMQFSEKGISLV
jgi:hypothetical protein